MTLLHYLRKYHLIFYNALAYQEFELQLSQ